MISLRELKAHGGSAQGKAAGKGTARGGVTAAAAAAAAAESDRLKDMQVVKMGRLSVSKVHKAEWDFILALETEGPPAVEGRA